MSRIKDGERKSNGLPNKLFVKYESNDRWFNTAEKASDLAEIGKRHTVGIYELKQTVTLIGSVLVTERR